MNEQRPREIWFDGRAVPEDRRDIWDLVNNSPLRKIVVSVAQRQKGLFPVKTDLITEVRQEEDLAAVCAGETALSDCPALLGAARERGCKTCIHISVTGRVQLEESCLAAAKYDYALIDFDLPTNIPLELILARLQERRTVLLRRAQTVDEMEVAFGVLEAGSDGVLLACADPGEIRKLPDYLRRASIARVELQPMTVQELVHAGMGMRGCIDTTSLMSREEGMLIGSTSTGGVFVCSETHYLPYMNLRPFRVNAGAVHSYVWTPDGRTAYLTDLAVGARVLCVDTRGEARELTVGRVKIEARPLLLIKGEAGGAEINVIVQDDWHIRLMGGDGSPRNATEIKPGDELLAYTDSPGRHVGIPVAETIIER